MRNSDQAATIPIIHMESILRLRERKAKNKTPVNAAAILPEVEIVTTVLIARVLLPDLGFRGFESVRNEQLIPKPNPEQESLTAP
jgi:hypothetical protein